MMMNRRSFLVAMLLSASLLLTTMGCARFDLNTPYAAPDRLDRGLVVILPGIEGESSANESVRAGLYKAGIPYGLVIYRWGAPLPGLSGMLVNQTDVSRNRHVAGELAGEIAQYQRNHPGKPVFLIGHSAGGGIAVFTMEALAQTPGAKPVEGAFLLSASLSSDYNLTPALAMSRRGLVNVSNKDDQLLNSGTGTFGNVDGERGDSCGRTGFTHSYPNVYERRITNEQVRKEFGIIGPAHFSATHEQLIERYAPGWIMSPTWPPPRPGAKQ